MQSQYSGSRNPFFLVLLAIALAFLGAGNIQAEPDAARSLAAATNTSTRTPTRTATASPLAQSTATPTALAAPSATRTPTATATKLAPASATPSVAASSTRTRSATAQPTATPTKTLPAAASPTPTKTVTPRATNTPSPTPTKTASATPTRTATATKVATSVVSVTPFITTTLGTEADISPLLGGELRIDNGAIVVQFPAGVVPLPAGQAPSLTTGLFHVRFEPAAPDVDKADPMHQRVIQRFALRAFDRANPQKEITQFQKPIRITVRYNPSDLAGWKEKTLALVYWDTTKNRWLPFPSTVDTVRHTVTARTTHFTTFGVTSAPDVQSYLPNMEGFQTSLFTGAAVSDLGFELPPGRGQLVPKLSLGYSSTNVDMLTDEQQSSYVGLGWSLTNSYISRDTRSTYEDTDDVFVISLNGAAYDLAKGTDGFYHTEQEQYWRISFDQTNDRWLVITNDGTQYQYGYSQNSRAAQMRYSATGDYKLETYGWYLEKVIDVHANEISYTYLHDQVGWMCGGLPTYYDGAVYPQQIRYNGTAASGYLTQIDLTYSNRTDNRAYFPQYTCGPAPYGHQKLDRLDVSTTAGGTMQLVRRYAFSYDYSTFPTWQSDSGTYGRLTLKQVTRFGTDGTSALPPYTFSYGSNNRLSQSANGIGGTVAFTYDSVSVGSLTIYRVINKTVGDGISPSNTYTYSYTGAAVNDAAHSAASQTANPRHSAGTQFRGHSQVVVTDPLGNKTQNDYYQDDVFRGRASQIIQAGTSIATKYARAANTYGQTVIPIDPNATTTTGNYSNFVFLSTTQRETWDAQASPRTARTNFSYDGYGNLTQTDEWGENGSTYRKTQNAFYPNTTAWILNKVGLTQVFDGSNARVSETRYFYDGATSHTTAPTKGDLTRVDATDDGTTFFPSLRNTYDTYGNVLTTKDGVGNTTTFQYDSVYHLFLTTITNALNQTTTNVYDTRLGKVTSTTDPNNATSSYTYDVFGRTDTVRAPFEQGQAATMVYVYTLGNPRSSVEVRARRDAGGASAAVYHHTWFFYDGLGRVIQQQADGLNGQITLANTEYDQRGKIKRVSNPYYVTAGGGAYQTPDWTKPVTQHQYDPVGRETLQTNPDTTTRAWQYLLWTTTFTDENSHIKKMRNDAFGRTDQVQEINQGQTYTTGYAYDVMDRLRIVTDNSSNTTVMTYDWLGRKTDLTDPDLGHWTYLWDRVGNLKNQKDANSQKTCLYYDGLNRALGKVYVAGGTACPSNPTSYAVAFTYDQGTNGKGRRTGMSDASGTTSWVYDLQGRATSQTKTFTGQPALTTSWTYDAMNRPLTMTYPDGDTIATTYNTQNQIATLGSRVTGSSYNAANQLTTLNLGNGTTTTYTYNSQNLRLTNLATAGTASIQNLSYQYDNAGNVQTITDAVRSETSTFNYDDLNRLTSFNLSGAATEAHTWSYNPLGNITQRVANGVTSNYTYADSAHKHAVTLVGTSAYLYDANGNMTSRAGAILQYDEENRLKQMTETSGTITTYTYDGDGQRAKKDVTSGGTTTTTLYVGNYFEKIVQSGAMTTYFYFGSQRIGVRTGGQFYYLHADPLGSISVTTNGSQVVKGTLNYLPFGDTRVATGDMKTDYAFTGQRLETADGLLYYGAREYDATIGRFIQPDSIIPNLFNPQSLNRYSYVRNNPLKYTDPTGNREICEDPCGIPGEYDFSVLDNTPTEMRAAQGTNGAAPANTGNNQQASRDDYDDPTGIVPFIYQKMMDNSKGEAAATFAYWNSCTSPYCYQDSANPQMNAMAGFAWLNLPQSKFGSLGGGDWDYKPEIKRLYGGEQRVNDTIYDRDVWTNVHFGYVGMQAGFSEDKLLDGAGIAQIIGGHPFDGNLSAPRTFDDPRDQVAVKVGIELWRNDHLTLQPVDIVKALEATPGLKKHPATQP